MVHSVRQPEPVRSMHQPVRPVKPAVLHKQVEQQREWKIPHRHGVDVSVDPSPTEIPPKIQRRASRHSVDRRGQQRPTDFATDLIA